MTTGSMKIINSLMAFDLGTKTGWAYWDGYGVTSGHESFKVKVGESPGMLYVRARTFVANQLDGEAPDLIVYEEPWGPGKYAKQVLHGLVSIVMAEAAVRQIEFAKVAAMTLKKWATHNGRASKEDMVVRASELVNKEIKSDDEADAICALFWALEEFGLTKGEEV